MMKLPFKSPLFLFLALNFVLQTNLGCAHKNTTTAPQQETTTNIVMINADVALSSLISLSDGHLKKIVDELTLFSRSSESRSGKWSKIQTHLAEIAEKNISAVFWFAQPNGSYWTADQGKVEGTLSTRAYWKKVLQGETVIGDLVVSKSTGQNVAIIAVPVKDQNNNLVGALGASIYLDKLSQQLKREMGLDTSYIFYAIDSSTQAALNVDSGLIFTRPGDFGEEMNKVFSDVISHTEGIANYHFHNHKRTVIYRKSSFSNWWYAFGLVQLN